MLNSSRKRGIAIIAMLPLAIIIFIPVESKGQTKYEEGDWVSYTDFHYVNDVAVGRNEIYIATSGGVLRYHRYKQKWLRPWVVVRGFNNSVDLRNAVNVDYLPEDDEVAVLTSKGAYYYNPISKYWNTSDHQFGNVLPTNTIEATFLSPPDFMLSRKSYFSHGNNTIMDSDLRKYYFGVAGDDEWGNIWVGINGIGILQLDKHTRRGTVWELGIFGHDVRSIVSGKGWYVLAGHNRDGGITFWKRKSNVWDHLEWQYTTGLESTWINDLAVSDKWLLAATDYGLAQINLKNGTVRNWTVREGLWSNAVMSVAVEKDTVWVGTPDGLCKLKLHKGPVTRMEIDPLRNQPCYRIAVDKDAVWIGSEIGLFRLDRKTGTGYYLGNEGGVGGPVFALHSSPKELWVGRYTGVEVVNKKTMEQTGYPSQAHFQGAEINALYAEKSLVWLGTNKGLWKYDRARERWHQYTQEDGLLDNRVYAIYPDGDYLLLGTADGVTRFYWNDPDRID